MRALFMESLVKQDSYDIVDEPLHHLLNVVRIQKGEELLLLNGKGRGIVATVQDVSRKMMKLRFERIQQAEPKFDLDLALGVPKKEALEVCLKEATEIGFNRIFLVRSQYSQMKIPEMDRLSKLLISALEQANGFYLPKLVECSWAGVPWNDYRSILLMTSQDEATPLNENESKSKASRLLVVGPEGGFSEEELTYFRQQPMLQALRLPTPILRTTTAVAVGAGVMMQRLLDR